jgi:hypothetical protein
MSMQDRLPEQVVPADAWTPFCAECSQKMRITRHQPNVGRKHVPTNVPAVTAKGSTWPFICESHVGPGICSTLPCELRVRGTRRPPQPAAGVVGSNFAEGSG